MSIIHNLDDSLDLIIEASPMFSSLRSEKQAVSVPEWCNKIVSQLAFVDEGLCSWMQVARVAGDLDVVAAGCSASEETFTWPPDSAFRKFGAAFEDRMVDERPLGEFVSRLIPSSEGLPDRARGSIKSQAVV